MIWGWGRRGEEMNQIPTTESKKKKLAGTPLRQRQRSTQYIDNL